MVAHGVLYGSTLYNNELITEPTPVLDASTGVSYTELSPYTPAEMIEATNCTDEIIRVGAQRVVNGQLNESFWIGSLFFTMETEQRTTMSDIPLQVPILFVRLKQVGQWDPTVRGL